MGHHYPPSLERVTEEAEFYIKKNSDLSQIFNLHKAILKAQITYLERINISVTLTEEELKDLFRNKKSVLSGQVPDVDTGLFKEVLISVCKAIKIASPEAPNSVLTLFEADEFTDETIGNFLHSIVSYNKEELTAFIERNEMDKRTGLDSEIISFIIFMSLSPFYSVLMQEVMKKVDFSIWRQGYCPVCGQTATIAKHRSEDGARVLECWLCHAQWVFPRLKCPFCNNTDQKTLRFFYVIGDKTRQVHICEKCKKYLKTIDNKEGKDVLLDVEAIGTFYLDELAEKEGYEPPGRVSLLN